jgi:hypothetical protein
MFVHIVYHIMQPWHRLTGFASNPQLFSSRIVTIQVSLLSHSAKGLQGPLEPLAE